MRFNTSNSSDCIARLEVIARVHKMAQNQNSVLEHILINYRWVFVCFFLLPASFLFDIVMHVRSWIVFKTRSAPKQHDGKVKNVQRQVREWISSGKRRRMCTARPGWQTISFRTPKYKSEFFQVEVNLVDILEVDEERKVVRVEPMVTMGALTARLNPLGWTIPVLPEIDDLTVGGLVMGTGIESTSHKHGLFQHICVSYELVLSDGSLVICSKESSPELFYSIPWSYGTLGLLTAVEIKIIPAKKYVKLTYHPIRNFEQIAQGFEQAASDDRNEFVEGIMFGNNEGVLMTGNLADIAEHNKVNAIGKWHKPWFFMHVKNMLQQESPVTEYIPLRDYYHRHTRSIFWELQDIIPFGNNPIFRYLLGWIVPPKISLLKLTQTKATKRLYETKHVIQDMLVPIKHLKTCINAFHENFHVYPIWLCPFSLPPAPGFVHPESPQEELYVDIGVYGVPKAENFNAKESVRAIEKLVIKCKGFQMLYADTFTSRQEFRQMFDHTLYDKLRDEFNCKEAFPEVYDKVCKEARL